MILICKEVLVVATRRLRDALEVTIASTPVLSLPRSAASVELARSLADKIDGGDTATQAAAAYLSALKDLNRLVAAAAGQPGMVDRDPAKVAAARDDVTAMRRKRGRGVA